MLKTRSFLPFWAIFLFQISLASWVFFGYKYFELGISDLEPFFRACFALLTLFLPLYAASDYSEEWKRGGWEMLLSYPLSTDQIVIGKYLSHLPWFLLHLLQISLLVLPMAGVGEADSGILLSSFLGFSCYGAWILGATSLISALTRKTLLSYLLSIGSILLWYNIFSFTHWTYGFLRGIVPIRNITFFCGTTFLFLLGTTYIVEGWKSK
ncbi:MAG: ABC transporter permease subunit [Spirochaetales bacterium]